MLIIWTDISAAKTPLGDLFETQTFIENTLKLSEAKLEDQLPFALIKEVLKKECPSKSIQEAEAQFQELKGIWKEKIPSWKFAIIMKERFQLLTKVITSINTREEARFCQQKYLTFSLLELTQDLTLSKKPLKEEGKLTPLKEKETEIQAPKLTTSSEAEHGSATEEKYLDLTHHTEKLKTKKEKTFALRAERSIQNLIWEMRDQKILNTEDIARLDGKISVQYFSNCEKTRGSFHVLKNKSTQSHSFKGINLAINLCKSQSFDKRFDNYVRQILTHELGHYMYFFKDQKTQDFDQICWNGKQKRCESSGFFSRYAETNKEEDYAESFAYWYLDSFNGKEKEFWSAPANEAKGKKEFHFTELLKTLR